MRKILFVGAEVMPFAATGGLGDVLGSLPAALKKEYKDDIDIRVVMPLYDAVKPEWRNQMKLEAVFNLQLSWRNLYCGVLSLEKDGVTYYFIDNEYYFKRGALYGYGDEAERYAFFCKAAIEMLGVIGYYPDILHAHDWQAALTLPYLNFEYRWRKEYQNIKTVFTIHNIEYQGQFSHDVLSYVFGFDYSDYLDYNGCVNLMKCAIEMANMVTTVSPRYSEEIKSDEYSHGLAPILNKNAHKLTGILNGIDYKYYNPETDKEIFMNFASGELEKKVKNKTELQRQLGLPEREDVPLVAIISRLASHKGLDLIREVAYGLVDNNDMQLVVLGKGEAQYEEFFTELERNRNDKVRALMLYDRDLSKRIYAACDIFLMPSKSEPCGLSQMIASRYGAIPVVRETGGLYDSIKGYWLLNGTILGNGFTFANYYAGELYERTSAALELYHNKELYPKFAKKIMDTDFSWGTSARKYYMLYERV
ncbi:MAG: glycogen synthase [Clostridia bacterium]|nr:glycogen synthase [Clostridia bacterium]